MFNEVFFTDAPVPVAYRLGEEGQGWNVAMGTLGHERVGTAGLSIGLKSELDGMIAAARKHNPDALDDPDIRDRIARAWTQIELTRLLNARALSKVLKGEKTLARGAARQAAVELPVPDPGRAQRRHPRPRRAAGQGRPGRRRRRPRRLQLPVAALHVDRRRRHRGAEEHHRRPGHPTPRSAEPFLATGLGHFGPAPRRRLAGGSPALARAAARSGRAAAAAAGRRPPPRHSGPARTGRLCR